MSDDQVMHGSGTPGPAEWAGNDAYYGSSTDDDDGIPFDVESAIAALPAPGHQLLNVFAGRWVSLGRQFAGPLGPAATIQAIETYDWLPGGFFLQHRFDGHVGAEPAACMEVMGHDAVSGRYFVNSYYNTGLTNCWQADAQSDDTWVLHGDWTLQGKSTPIRCTMEFSAAHDHLFSRWEYLDGLAVWRPLWDVESRRSISRGLI
jgi:hypothetical protein